jgi:hypothetical protein
MNKLILTKLLYVLVLLVLSACNNTPDVQVSEISNNTVSYDDTIHINNCGGKANSEQIASRSFATTIGGEAEFKAGYGGVIQGSISAEYSQYKNISKSMRLIAPPGTNMEFVLRWSEEVHAGNVSVGGQTGTYEVHIPIAVEQVSSRDLGGCATDSLQAPQASATPLSTEPPVAPTLPSSSDALVTRLFLGTDLPLVTLLQDFANNPSQATQAQLETAARTIQSEADRLGSQRLESSSLDLPQGQWWLVWCSNAPAKYTTGMPAGWVYLFEQQLPTFGQLLVISPEANSRHLDSCNSPEGWWGVQVFNTSP